MPFKTIVTLQAFFFTLPILLSGSTIGLHFQGVVTSVFDPHNHLQAGAPGDAVSGILTYDAAVPYCQFAPSVIAVYCFSALPNSLDIVVRSSIGPLAFHTVYGQDNQIPFQIVLGRNGSTSFFQATAIVPDSALPAATPPLGSNSLEFGLISQDPAFLSTVEILPTTLDLSKTTDASPSSLGNSQIVSQLIANGVVTDSWSIRFKINQLSSGCTCDANGDGMVDVADIQFVINQILAGASAACHPGSVNVADVQRIINAVLGFGCS